MESTETSVIARKLKNFYSTQHTRPRVVPRPVKAAAKTPSESGIFKHLILVTLMGAAVFFTEISLRLVRFARKLEA